MTASIHEREAFLAAEYALFEEARRRGDRLAAWHHLERAHIVAQPLLGAHLLSHGYMLRYAIEVRDAREVAGQIMSPRFVTVAQDDPVQAVLALARYSARQPLVVLDGERQCAGLLPADAIIAALYQARLPP